MRESIIKGDDNIRYSATQVADMFDLPVSTVRHYMTAFADILDLEYSNKMRKFTKPSLKKFEYILKLREDGLTIQQIQNYCEKEDMFNEEGLLPRDNPLAVELFTESIKLEIQKQLDSFRTQIKDDIRSEMKLLLEAQYKVNDDLRHELSITLDDMISEKLNVHLDGVKDIADKLGGKIEDIHKIAHISLEEIKNNSYKEGFGRKLYKLLFGNK